MTGVVDPFSCVHVATDGLHGVYGGGYWLIWSLPHTRTGGGIIAGGRVDPDPRRPHHLYAKLRVVTALPS